MEVRAAEALRMERRSRETRRAVDSSLEYVDYIIILFV